tara:strand:- start:197 stop:496 length:300 start_codon:yes stop_codon:yes gene_type:complete
MTKTRLNLSEESTLQLIGLLRHDLEEWANFYTDNGLGCDTEDDPIEWCTNQIKHTLSWKILNQLKNSNFFETQKIAKEWQVKRIKKDINNALNPWNFNN